MSSLRVARRWTTAENLAPTFLTQIVNRYAGTRLGRPGTRRAELLEDAEGALWTRDLIEEGRCSRAEMPPMQRIVVAGSTLP